MAGGIMGQDREYTDYQKKLIRRHYDNQESNDEQRLAEMATNLYLTTGKRLDKLWEQVRDLLTRMRVPPSRVEHVVASKDATLVAVIVQEVESGTLKRLPKPAE